MWRTGHGNEEDRPTIACIDRFFPAGIVQVACGENHSAALGLDGRLFTWGRNKYGQLGLGHLDDCPIPNFVRSLLGTAFAQVKIFHVNTCMARHASAPLLTHEWVADST